MRSRPRLRRPRQWSTYSGPPKGGLDCTSQSLLNSWHNQAKVLGLSEERQVSMLITQGLRSRELAESACRMKMAKLGSTRDVAPRWGPGINNWDMGFFKDTAIGEKLHMEFRSEIYNIWNHSQFYSMDGNISDGPKFGLAQKARDPRLVQFGLKFLF